MKDQIENKNHEIDMNTDLISLNDSSLHDENSDILSTEIMEGKWERKKKIFLASIIILIIVIFLGIFFWSTIPKNLKETTTLENGSYITFKGSYLMEVPCYSFSARERDYDTEGKDFLCISLLIKNNDTKGLNVEEICSGEIKNSNGNVINDDIIYLSERKDEENIQIPSYSEKTILIAFPIPENYDIASLKTTLIINGDKYNFLNGYQDVRQFVRDMSEQTQVATEIMSDIMNVMMSTAQTSNKAKETSNPFLLYMYAKQIADNFYEELEDMGERNLHLIDSLNALNAPDIPFYQQTKQDMIDDANERIGKLEKIKDIDYPTNTDNANENFDIVLEVFHNFSNLGVDDMFNMGQHWLVEFKN